MARERQAQTLEDGAVGRELVRHLRLREERAGCLVVRIRTGGYAGERRLPGLAETGIQRQGNGGVDCGSSDIGRGVEIDVEGQIVLVAKGVDLEGAERFVGLDLGALAQPAGSRFETDGSLLQGVEQKSGATVINAVVCKGVDDLLNAGLHGVHVIENGHLETALVAVQTCLSSLDAAGTGVEVEVAVTLVAKSGRTAVDAIFHEMVTRTVGHQASKKRASRFSPFRSSRNAKRALIQAAGMPAARVVRSATGGLRPHV